jgi:hypothetical protein
MTTALPPVRPPLAPWASAHRALLVVLAVVMAAVVTSAVVLLLMLNGDTTGVGGAPLPAPDLSCPGGPPNAAC